MLNRIGDAMARKPFARQPAQAMVGGGETGMLAGEDQVRGDPGGRERMGERGQLDGFRTRADNQLDTISGQRSP